MSSATWIVSVAAVAASIAPASAQTATLAFRIPAGSMDEALRAYARTTGSQILYRPQDVEGLRSDGLEGAYAPVDALAALLRGTSLVADHPSARVVVVRRVRTVAVDDQEPAPTPDVVVTGSNLRGGEPASPVRVLGRKELERSGRATIAELIAAQTANFGGTGNPVASLTAVDRTSANVTLAPAANLRGLGSDATLTLFDGRRTAGSGGRGNFTDLSAVPSLAIERVEILADGASAVYGSDAVGGVVNLVTRRRYEGAEIRLRGGLARGGPADALAGLVVGRAWKGGSFLVAYDFDHRDDLPAAQRPYTATGDLRPFGGTDHRTYLSSPGTILRLDPVSRSYVPAYAIPTLPAGKRPTAADILPGANLTNLAAGVSLSPNVDRHAAYTRIEQDVAHGLGLFAEARYAHRDFAYGAPPAQTIFAVTPADPFFIGVAGQPFSVVAYSFLNDLGPSRTRGRVDALAATGGLRWDVGRWAVDGYGTFARERSSERISNQLNSTLLAEALGNVPDSPATSYSAARDGYFDPYGSGAANGPAVIAFLGSGFTAARRRSSLVEALAKAEGPLATLPGGGVRLAVGASFRRETLRTGGTTFTSGTSPTELATRSLGRDVRAVFAEASVPVVGPANASPGLVSLRISAAVRHEDHDGFGGTTNPRLGLTVSPVAGLVLRGAWGTSFRAPALTEAGEPRRVVATSLTDVGGSAVPVIFVAGGNPAIGPERADTLSVGIELDASRLGAPGLSTAVNAFRTDFRDRISQPALIDASRALTNADLAPFVRRISPLSSAADLAAVNALLAEPGSSLGLYPATSYAAIIDGRSLNTGSVLVSGLDWDLAWSGETGIGRLSSGVTATWLFRYVERLTPVAAPVERLGRLGRPNDLRVRGRLGWSGSGFDVTAFGNYVDGYLDEASMPARPVSGWFTVDLTIGHAFGSGPLRGVRLLASAENLLDRDPPFVDRANGFGFDAANANPFGRRLALEIRRSF